jgi:aminoglycoside phosphotransferase (APT) family kinase protein
MDRATYINELHARYGVARAVVDGLVERVTGQNVASAQRVISGDENEVHRVDLADGQAVFLRVSFPGTPATKARNEAWAMGRARAAGVPVPEVLAVEPIETDDGERTAMVVRAADGRHLRQLLPSLAPAQRSAAMTDVGRVLGILHSIPMPGLGVPDEQGVWVDPEEDLHRYVAAVVADCQHLPEAGLSPAEVRRVVEVVEDVPPIAAEGPPVLCHGDVSAEHVFVDAELRVVGLIDWGLWRGGSAASEFGGVAMTTPQADFDAIVTGHRRHRDSDVPTETLVRQIRWHTIAQATGQIRWLLRSGQTGELPRLTTVLRNATAR